MIEIDVLPASSDAKGGDSILIRIGEFSYDFPRQNKQTVILIDGGYVENAERIENYLNNYYHTDTIDVAIITHPDMDHISGFLELLNRDNISISKTYIHDPWTHAKKVFNKTTDGRRTINSINNKFEETLKKLSETLNSIEHLNNNPFPQKIGNFGLHILGPSEKRYIDLLLQFPGMDNERHSSISEIYDEKETSYNKSLKHFLENPITSPKNDSSIITLLVDKNSNPVALFTGDAGVDSITNALNYADSEGIKYTNVKLMQLPHHGSIKNISEEIIKRVNPDKVFVSAPPNKIEHPSKLVVNYLIKNEIPVRHIKNNHGISFRFDGAKQRPNWSVPVEFTGYSKVNKLREDNNG